MRVLKEHKVQHSAFNKSSKREGSQFLIVPPLSLFPINTPCCTLEYLKQIKTYSTGVLIHAARSYYYSILQGTVVHWKLPHIWRIFSVTTLFRYSIVWMVHEYTKAHLRLTSARFCNRLAFNVLLQVSDTTVACQENKLTSTWWSFISCCSLLILQRVSHRCTYWEGSNLILRLAHTGRSLRTVAWLHWEMWY